MIDLEGLLRSFESLHELVAAEAELRPFEPAVQQLVEQARMLVAGTRDLPQLLEFPKIRIPNRDLALSVYRVIAAGPGLDGSEDDMLLRAYARLQANLAEAIYFALWEHEVIPSIRTGTP